jgi:ABC-type nitrate/sulfonate/bicarbonate transport system substrate-binding protein
VRRGDGPKGCFDYTMASIATTERLIARSPEVVAAAVRAIVKTQNALKKNVALAGEVGAKLFPPAEAELIVDLIRRDLPYYDASIPESFVAGMNRFAGELGLLTAPVAYENVVATQFSRFWQA